MGFCVYFHRTWTPGFNSECIDPNLAYSFQRRLQVAKKVAAWIFVMMLMICIIALFLKLNKTKLPDCPGNGTLSEVTPLSQATAESRFQPLEPTPVILPDLMAAGFSVNPVSSTSQETNVTKALYDNQPGFNENEITEEDVTTTEALNPTSVTDPSLDTEEMESQGTEDPEVTEVTEVTKENLNKEIEEKDLREYLDIQLMSSESDESVKRNMTTREESSTKRLELSTGCLPSDFRCNSTGKCIAEERKCDGRFDCVEPQEIRGNGTEAYVDRSDERDCTCRPNLFTCDKTSVSPAECIHMSLVCDSLKDCKNGKDEDICTAVSESLTKVTVTDKRRKKMEGYVLVRVRGSWHPYCKKDWSTELGRNICKFFGFKKLVALQTIELMDLNRRIGVNLTGGGRSSEESVRTEKSTLWVLNGNEDYMSITGGPIEDVVTEANVDDDQYDCTVGHILCSNF